MNEKITTYKGVNKDLTAYNNYRYEIGKTEKDNGAIRCGDKGFHSCEAPMDVLRYYPLRYGNRYFECEAGGLIDKTSDYDTKIASSELTLKAEIGLPGLIKAQIAYTRKRAEEGTPGGYNSNLAGGESSLIAGRDGGKVKGGKNSVLVLTEWRFVGNERKPVTVSAVVVDGETIKANTWYTLKDGLLVEVGE